MALHNDIETLLTPAIEHLVYVDDIRKIQDIYGAPELTKLYEMVIEKYANDFRFAARFLIDDFLLSVMSGIGKPIDDLMERMSDLCDDTIALLINRFNAKIEEKLVSVETELDLERFLFNRESAQYVNSL